MLIDSTSDTVNIMQGSVITDTIPEMQQITPLIRELFLKEEVIALVLFGSVARGQARSISFLFPTPPKKDPLISDQNILCLD
jgi:hypothetical protein